MDPFYQEIKNWLEEVLQKESKRPLVVGISAPQGAGKTTLSSELVKLFKDKKVVSVSVDDFYFTHSQQQALAADHTKNPYLQQRGYPGTHDIKLGDKILSELKTLRVGQELLVPRYDKSAFSGKGDRFSREKWAKIKGPIDLVLFDGWMLGFVAPATSTDDPNILAIDWALEPYSQWYKHLDAMIYLKAKDYRYVLDWRVEAEQNMRAQGKPGMSEAEVRSYAEKFMPAYERYQDTICPAALGIKHFLTVQIGKDRRPVS